MRKVYYPCLQCGGQGRTLETSPHVGSTNPISSNTYKTCNTCHGTCKGKIKEIIEDDVTAPGDLTDYTFKLD